ncbi:MAG: arylsulfatase [Pseudomonadota bacterium]
MRTPDLFLRLACALAIGLCPAAPVQAAIAFPRLGKAEPPPNILIILADNLGYGELGSYGGGATRGAPTPRLDALANQGLRLTNFNTEPQCTPSRSALMTARFAIRSGTHTVPYKGGPEGLTAWEVTLPEMLAARGYVSGHFGKWHLGSIEGRLPTDQGFDEWYGIPRSTDEALWTSTAGYDPALAAPTMIMEGRKGSPSRAVKVYDMEARRSIDAELRDRAIDFMGRAVSARRPFLAYVPLTQVHLPTVPNRAFAGRTGNGDWADTLAELDANAGALLDALKRLGVEKNTIVIFASDNGAEGTPTLEWRGWSGPWRGHYFTTLEGGLRAPFIVRWPGHVEPGRVSDEIVHLVDIMPTLAAATGSTMPTDRIIDGVDLVDFLEGRRPGSGREGFPVFNADRLQALKWRHWKLHFYRQDNMADPPLKLPLPALYDLYVDPREEQEVTIKESWVYRPMLRFLAVFQASLVAEPPIPEGTPDPYVPPARR